MTPKEILRSIAQELKEHPDHWGKGSFALDATGRNVATTSPDAVCWCIMGMIRKYTRPPSDPRSDIATPENYEGERECYELVRAQIHTNIPTWNDHYGRTVDEVIAVVERAAA